MTSPHNKPLFLYSYDPPSPRRLSEYDPPFPKEVLSTHNEKNYLKFELNQSYFYEEEQSQTSFNEELDTKVTTSNFGIINANENELKDSPFCDHHNSPYANITQHFNDMNLDPTTASSEVSLQSFSEEFNNCSLEATEVLNSKNELSNKKTQDIDCDLIDFSESCTCREVVATLSDNCNGTTEYSHSPEKCKEKKLFSKEDQSNSIPSIHITEKSQTSVVDSDSFVPGADTTSSDVAKCSSPLSTTHSISSLPSDTITINVPCDWSTSDSDLLSLDFDSNIPNTTNGFVNYLSSFDNNSDISPRNNLAASFTASIDSALTSSPPFSPALTESCTITPLPNDCATPNSTNPTSTPLPSPIPSDLLIAASSESSPSTPSTVTTSDMFSVSKILEHLAENVIKNVSETNNDFNSKLESNHCSHISRGCTDNAESAAISAKDSIVAQLSAIFENRNVKSSNNIGIGTDNLSCDNLQKGHIKQNNKNKENEQLIKKTLNLGPLIDPSKEMSFDERVKLNINNITNEVINIEYKKSLDALDDNKVSLFKCFVPPKYPPSPPSRVTSSSERPPPLPPPPVEECNGEPPPVPELPLNFRLNFYYSSSSTNGPPIPPVRQYLLIPLTPGRKTPILFSPPCIPPRSVSLTRTPIPPKQQIISIEKSSQDNFLSLESENLYHNTVETEPSVKEIAPAMCSKKENGFIQILTPVPEERSSPITTSPSSLMLTEKEVKDSELLDHINREQVTTETNNLNSGFNLDENVPFVGVGNNLNADGPPPLPPLPEEQINCCPPPLPPKPCLLKLSAAFSSPPPTPPPPPPKRSKSLSSTPLPIIIFSAPNPISENPMAVSPTTMMEDSCKGNLAKLNEGQKFQTEPPSKLPTPPDPPVEPAKKPSLTSVSPYGKFVVNRTDLPLLCPEEEIRKVMANAKSYGWINSEEDTLAIYSQVRPIIQQGPQCGLVALSMVSQLCSSTVSVEKLLEIARQKEYSTHGEMFSAEYMKSLANEALKDIQATVRTDIFDNPASIVNTLMNGDFILAPYDADRNHQPGLSHGKKAHWGLICGCLLQSSSMVLKQELTTAKLDVQMDNLWHFRPIQLANTLPEDRPSSVTPTYPQLLQEGRRRNARSVSPNAFTRDVSVISPLNGDYWSQNISNLVLLWRQGKSRNLIMSPFEDLQRSNQQLVEYHDRKDYVIDNIETTLSGQVVVLHKVRQSLSDLLGVLQWDLKF